MKRFTRMSAAEFEIRIKCKSSSMRYCGSEFCTGLYNATYESAVQDELVHWNESTLIRL